jgi:hypothetical protein
VEVTADDLRQYYRSISDDVLREINPADLTEIARKYYRAELEKRGLTCEVTESPADAATPAAGEDQEHNLKIEPGWMEHAACPCFYTAYPSTNYPAKAEEARNVLLAAGIPCEISVVPPDSDSEDGNSRRYGEYRVLVPEALNLKAISVLDREIFNPELEDDWRAHFASLSDQQLGELKPEVICAGLLDRVDRLTRAYQDEVARRLASNPST